MHHEQLTAMRATEMGQKIEAKPHETVLMGKHQRCDLVGDDTIHQGQELRTLEVQPTANFTDPLGYREPPGCTKLL